MCLHCLYVSWLSLSSNSGVWSVEMWKYVFIVLFYLITLEVWKCGIFAIWKYNAELLAVYRAILIFRHNIFCFQGWFKGMHTKKRWLLLVCLKGSLSAKPCQTLSRIPSLKGFLKCSRQACSGKTASLGSSGGKIKMERSIGIIPVDCMAWHVLLSVLC